MKDEQNLKVTSESTTAAESLLESSSTSDSSTGESSDVPSTTDTVSSTSTDPISPTDLPEMCDNLLTSDAEIQFPTKDITFDKQQNISWWYVISIF